MRLALIVSATVFTLLAAAPAWAQGQQMTQPSATQNQSQVLQNNGQQPRGQPDGPHRHREQRDQAAGSDHWPDQPGAARQERVEASCRT